MRELARGALRARGLGPRGAAASGPARARAADRVVVRHWERDAGDLRHPGRHRRRARDDLRARTEQRVRLAAIHQSRRDSRIDRARDALLRVRGDGRPRSGAHDAGLLVRGLQIPAGGELAHGIAPSSRDARDGLHRAATPLGPGRVLVDRGRGGASRPGAGDRGLARAAGRRGQQRRRRHAHALLRDARVPHPRRHLRPDRHAPVPRGEAWDLGAAGGG